MVSTASPKRRWLQRVLVYLLVLIILLIVAGLSAPVLVNRLVLANLDALGKLQISEIRFDHLGLFSASGTLRLSADADEVVAVPRFQLSYTPRGLAHKKLAGVTIDRALVHLERSPAGIGLRGLPAKSTTADSADPLLMASPVAVAKLDLRNCTIVLHHNRQPTLHTTISGRFTASYSEGSKGGYSLDSIAGSYQSDGAIAGSGWLEATFQGDTFTLNTTVDSLHLVDSAKIMPGTVLVGDSTTLGGQVKLRFALSSRTVSAIEGELEARDYRVVSQVGDTRVVAAGKRFQLRLNGSPEALRYESGPLILQEPLAAQVAVSGSLSVKASSISSDGTIDLQKIAHPSSGFNAARLSGSYQALFSAQNGLDLRLQAATSEDAGFAITGQAGSVRGDRCAISGELTLNGDRLGGEATLNIDRLNSTMAATDLAISGIAASLTVKSTSDTADGRINLRVSEARDRKHGWYMKNAVVDLPFLDPHPSKNHNKDTNPNSKGIITLTELGRKNTPLAGYLGDLALTADGFEFTGALTALFDPALYLKTSGVLEPTKKNLDLSWQLPISYLSSSALPRPFTVPEGISVDGFVEAQGSFSFALSGSSINGSATVQLSDGLLTDTRREITIGGISCSLSMPQLPAVISAPSQSCSISSVTFGSFTFSDLGMTFRLEDEQTLFIEKAKAGWCDGTLESASVRLKAGSTDLDTTLFASRINFAALLKQFGFDNTEGAGSLNGKLPVRISAQGIFFDDGFLFSTPGAGGIIRFADTQILRQSMAGAEQSSNLDYAMSALEDFSYNWARLSFTNKEDNLLLSMELDGKPRTPLPYAANRQGILVRSDKAKGIQYPLRLDLNLNLPLPELLGLGKNINSLFGEKRP